MSASAIAVTKIIDLAITPYNEDISNYINGLDPSQIYRLFNERTSAEVQTAALYFVSRLESSMSKTLISGEIWNQCPNGIINIDPDILKRLGDVYMRDDMLFTANRSDIKQYPHALVLTIDDVYAGHIYVWTVNMEIGVVTNVIGARPSLTQIIMNKCGIQKQGIAPVFLDAVRNWILDNGNQSKNHYIRVLQPIGSMPSLLAKCGFSLAKSLRNIPEIKWLFDNLSLGNTPLTIGLIFREYDYIIKVADPLKCVPPYYHYK